MRLISIHVPKTGGTALRAALTKRYTVATYYRGLTGPARPDIIHGHIPVSAARSRWPHVPTMAFIRHPYQQIRSNFDHYLRHPHTEFDPDIGQLPQGLTFDEFIRLPFMANYQCRFVDGPVDMLGTNEALADGIKQANRLFGLQVPIPARQGVTPRPTVLTAEHCRTIQQLHGADLALYGSAT